MPRNARCVLPGLPYHVTQRGSNRQRVFFAPSDYKMYLSLVRDQIEDSGTRILAYCLMTNHVHLVVVPERADSLAVLFRRVHGRYAQYLNTRRRRTGHLWQQRFFSCPLSESRHWVAIRYVEQNPCRALMASAPGLYRWSSAGVHLGEAKDRLGLLDVAYWQKAGGPETWRELHASGDGTGEVALLRRCTYAGRPFGDEEFLVALEERFQRSWRRWGFENRAASA